MGSPTLTLSRRRAGRKKDELREGGRHPQGLQAEPHGAGAWTQQSDKPIWRSREVIKYDPTLGYLCPLEQYGGELREVGTFQMEQQQCSEVRGGDNILLSSEARKVRGGEEEEGELFNVEN